jgi:DNA polymerase III subunit alpha
VLPPDVNASDLDFTPAGDAIRYGLSAVRNVGAGAVGQITEARRTRGSFSSFTDFCRKVDPAVLHRKALESLILAGAFDSLGYTRRGLLDGYGKVLGPILADRRAETIGQGLLLSQEMGSALDIDESVLAAEEFDRPLFLTNEKQMLGQFVTDHPLLGVRERLEARTDIEISELPALGDGDVVRVGGIITALARRFSRRGEPYVVFRLEDLAGGVQVVAFPSLFEQAGDRVAPDRIVLVRGRIDLRGRELQIVAQEIGELDGDPEDPGPPAGPPPGTEPLLLSVPTAECTNGLVTRLKQTLAAHPGGIPVVLRLVSEERDRTLRLSDGYRVDASAGLMAELRTILGGSAVARPNGSG